MSIGASEKMQEDTESDISIITMTKKREPRRLHGVDSGWSYVVAVASFMTHALMATLYFGYAVLTPAWKQEFHSSSGMTSLVGSAASGFSSGLAPIASYLSNRFDHRTTHMIGGVVASIGVFSCSFATNLEQIFVFYGFFGGLGIGICYLPAVMIVRSYFHNKYAIFMGFASCGIGVGSCVFPLIIEYLESKYGWRGAMLVLSAVMANMCVSAAAFFPNPIIESNTQTTEVNGNFLSSEQVKTVADEKEFKQLASTPPKVVAEKSFLKLSLKTFKDSKFQLGVVNNFTNFFCMMLVIGLTPMRSQYEFNMTPEQGALLAASIGFSNTIARFLWGVIYNMMKDKIDPFKFFLLLRVVTSLITFASIFGTSFNVQLMCCILLGAGFGNWSLYPIFIPKMFDVEIVDIVYGYLEIFNGIGCLVGPFIGGFIFDVTKSFSCSFLAAGSVLLLGSVVLYVGDNLIENKRRQRKQLLYSLT